MAIYRFEAKVISRGAGRSTVGAASYQSGRWATASVGRGGKCATSAAAYRAAEVLEDERTGERYDYSRKRGVLGAEIMLPEGAPAWMMDRSALWNAVEIIEKRKDAQLARDFIISLPHELDHEQRVALTRKFVREQFCARGYVADIAWHAPDRADGLNWHAHVMVGMRRVEGTGFAAKKDRAAGDGLKHPSLVWKEELGRLREVWAETANKHLAAAGLDIVIDHRSLEARGIDRLPEPKQGPVATQIEREGRESLAGGDRRAVKEQNAERAQLKVEHAKAEGEEAQIIDLLMHRLRRDRMLPTNEEVLQQQQDREAHRLREMQAREESIQRFKRQREEEAEEAKRKKEDLEKETARCQNEGDIASASARYKIALGEQYDMRDPYGSLARAAMSEYAAFHKNQENMRAEIAREQDVEKRREIELRKQIEANEYMAITSNRLAEISEYTAGPKRVRQPGIDEGEPKQMTQAEIDRERATAYQRQANEMREERSRLIEERERREREDTAGKLHSIEDSVKRGASSNGDGNTRKAEGEHSHAGRKDKDAEPEEMTDAKQAKAAKREATKAAYAEYRKDKNDGRDKGGGRDI
jgi:hypothetical protein